MRRTGPSEGGTSVVEFVVVVVLLMVPLAYAVVALSKLHAASSAVIVAAREATRAYVKSDTPTSASYRARRASALALADQGVSGHRLNVRCSRGACLAPNSRVTVEVATDVALPLLPFRDGRGSITVSSVHEATVDTFRAL